MRLNDDGTRIDEEEVKITTIRGACPHCKQDGVFLVGSSVACLSCNSTLDTTCSPLIALVRKPPV